MHVRHHESDSLLLTVYEHIAAEVRTYSEV